MKTAGLETRDTADLEIGATVMQNHLRSTRCLGVSRNCERI